MKICVCNGKELILFYQTERNMTEQDIKHYCEANGIKAFEIEVKEDGAYVMVYKRDYPSKYAHVRKFTNIAADTFMTTTYRMAPQDYPKFIK